MTQIAIQKTDQSSARPLTTAPIDRGHLSRMSLSDISLEREFLRLFDRKAAMLMTRMRIADPPLALLLAHTLKNSAQSIGAWNIARAAEGVELADGIAAEAELAFTRLGVAVEEAQATIAKLLRAH